MKKISIFIIIAMILSSLAMFDVSAVEPKWTYECNKLAVPVKIDGKVDGNEWDDAVALVVNADSEILKKYGVWQVDPDNPIPSSILSVTYRVKWDETYLYILEERFDKAFSYIPDAGPWPWEASGTLFFLTYSADYANPDTDGCYEIFWVNNADGAPKLCGRGPGKKQFADDIDSDEWKEFSAGWKIANSVNGDTYLIEAAIPWATMANISGFAAPKEGLKLRFTPIIPSFHEKTTTSFENWNQINFYCDPEVGPADNPESNGGMILKGVNYTAPVAAPEVVEAPAAAAVEEAPAPAPAAVKAPAAAPKTGDSALAILAILMLGACAITVTRRVKSK